MASFYLINHFLDCYAYPYIFPRLFCFLSVLLNTRRVTESTSIESFNLDLDRIDRWESMIQIQKFGQQFRRALIKNSDLDAIPTGY